MYEETYVSFPGSKMGHIGNGREEEKKTREKKTMEGTKTLLRTAQVSANLREPVGYYTKCLHR